MSNQTAAAIAAFVNSINWEHKGLDLQAIIEAGNQGKLRGPSTDWLVNRGWEKETETKSISPKSLTTLLDPVGTVKVPATTTPFVAKDHFVVNTDADAPVKIYEVWNGFKTRFLQGDGKIEKPIGDSDLRYARLKKRSTDTSILEELGGGKKTRTTLTEVWSQMLKHPKGEKGTLLVNGNANIFYVETEVILPEEEHLAYVNEEDKKVVLCAVYVFWSGGGGWFVGAYSVLYANGWFVGDRVFSRNSELESSEPVAPAQA